MAPQCLRICGAEIEDVETIFARKCFLASVVFLTMNSKRPSRITPQGRKDEAYADRIHAYNRLHRKLHRLGDGKNSRGFLINIRAEGRQMLDEVVGNVLTVLPA